MNGFKVLKFGGTSMGSADTIKQVIAIVRAKQKDAKIRAVVVSAMSGVTDQLIDIAKRAAAGDTSYEKLLQNLEQRHLQTVQSLVRSQNRTRAAAELKKLIGHLSDIIRGVRLVKELSPRALDYVMSYGERLSAHILTEAQIGRAHV